MRLDLRRLRLGGHQLVPLVVLAVCAAGIATAHLDLPRVTSDVLDRVARNLFLVLSLVIPIAAGLGLNFGIVLGAMAGQAGLLVVQNGQIGGVGGIVVATIVSIPIATLLGWATGRLFNRAPGREMITGIILGFFAAGIYQFVFMILAGPVLPIHARDVLLPEGGGMGVRVTIDLTTVERAVDGVLSIPLRIDGRFWGELPVVTLGCSVLLCVGIWLLFRTKLGQDLRAIGQDPHVAEVAGIGVRRGRVLAVVFSMVLAGIGQILFLQNMTVMNTFTSHEQVGFYAIAALLVGGATVARATIGHAVLGTVLFHTLIVVVSLAGQKLLASAQVGEYLREFSTYLIIGVTLALHAWKGRRPALARSGPTARGPVD